MAAVKSGDMSERKAAVHFDIPRSSLQDRLKNTSNFTSSSVKPRLGRKRLLSTEDEVKLVDYACNRASLGIGFGKRQFLQYAGSLAQKRKLKFKCEKPSQKWWRLLKKRHPLLTRRKPEGTASIRHRQMNKVYVGKYFSALKDVMDANNLHSELKKFGTWMKQAWCWNTGQQQFLHDEVRDIYRVGPAATENL